MAERPMRLLFILPMAPGLRLAILARREIPVHKEVEPSSAIAAQQAIASKRK